MQVRHSRSEQQSAAPGGPEPSLPPVPRLRMSHGPGSAPDVRVLDGVHVSHVRHAHQATDHAGARKAQRIGVELLEHVSRHGLQGFKGFKGLRL